MSTPLRVMIVEDSSDDAELLLRELRRTGYEPTSQRVATPETMQAALQGQAWDIVISDHRMPYFSSLAALATLQESRHDLPFIIRSGTIGEDVAVAAMKAGAHDSIMKGNMARLGPAVERELRDAEVRRGRDRAEQEERRLHEQLAEEHRQLEQRVRELGALNKLFQEHLSQRYAIIQDLQAMCEGLEQASQTVSALAERARAHSLADLEEVPTLLANDTPGRAEG